ncbi:type II secretion system secretin GspD [Sphingomonas changnyeongensis]|uniref:Type II secretion system secretin GspD n=1 Tax=Sphingomonas changnyeongensis TaxID=2698679 RepID=A0A7Z2NVZ8_9SPHN|nr:type II secretion system secretin GspD [Sphingomonas changnyeongensis]QHL90846.1 type II secretion system secretin GspD [Sphingomonas changnyeongensis]
MRRPSAAFTLGTAAALLLAAPAAAQYALNVRDADIRAFIQDAAKVTGRSFIIDQRVQGKVSVVTDRSLSRSEYLEVFLSTLRANGLVAVPAGSGAFRVQPLDGAASQPSRVGRAGTANALVTEIVRLRSIDAPSAAETVRPLVSREGSVTANRAGNSLVIVDFGDNVRRVREVLARIDRDSAATRVITLKNAGAREIAGSLSQLIGPGGAGAPGQSGGQAAASVVAVDSSNAVVLRGDPATVARLAQVAAELDQRAANGTEVRVHWLEHADAQLLLPVLQQLTGQSVTQPGQTAGLSQSRGLGGAGSAGGGLGAAQGSPQPAALPAQPVPPGESIIGRQSAIVTRFEGANAIIIAAAPDTQRILGEVVRQLDTRRDQVLVEAIIVEISDQLAKRLGVQFLLGGEPGSDVPLLATNYSNAQPNILTIAGAVAARELDRTTTTVNGQVVTTTTNSPVSDQLAQAAANAVLGATGGLGGFATNVGRNGIFGVILNAVRSDTASNLLSTPSIMTLDNQEARILVGQEIPITTGQALSNNFDNAFRTIQRQNVGIQLQVRPQINEGGAIKLILRQEVSSIAGPVSNSNQELILNKREIETTVTVDDGQIIALGGLLDDNERRTIEKIPLLGDIPGLGELFRSRSRSRAKTNLMVFIRPTILRTPEDARAVAMRRYGYVRAQQLDQQPDAEPTIDELVRDYMGAAALLPARPGTAQPQPAQPEPARPESAPPAAPGSDR